MRRKSRLIMLIISLVLILALMSIAIWAAVGADIGVGGDINIEAPDLNVKITGKMYGHHKDHMTEENAEELPGADWGVTTLEDGEENNLTWDNLDLIFVDKYTDIVIELSITNRHEEKAIVVGVDNKTDTEGKNFTLTIESSGTSTQDVISVGETIIYKMTFKIIDEKVSASGNFDITYSLSNAI